MISNSSYYSDSSSYKEKNKKKEHKKFIDTENDDDTLSINNHKIKLNNNIYADINNYLVSKENPFLKAQNRILEMPKNTDKNMNNSFKDEINYKYDNNPPRGFLYDNALILKKENILSLEENLKRDKKKKTKNFWYDKFEYL